ncbi:MAG TPA: head-tail connector protein [Pirellulales bacterium]|nr:head-tail connector protein [Pirellulales bacterium]
MNLTLVTPPAAEPVTLAEAKLHARINLTDDDDLVSALIVAARRYCEAFTRRQFVTATWNMVLDTFPSRTFPTGMFQTGTFPTGSYPIGTFPGGTFPLGALYNWAITLPLPPVQAVNSITYLDSAGDLQTLAPSQYVVDVTGEPARLTPQYGFVWPITRWQVGSVTVQFTAGYGTAADVPETVKAAIKLLVAHWYEHREAVSDKTMASVPLAVESLLLAEAWGSYPL